MTRMTRICAALCFFAWPQLFAQERLDLHLPKAADGSAFQFQLRATYANQDVKDLTGNWNGGGASCMFSFGDTPLRPRVRFDFDGIQGRDGRENLTSMGLGLEAVLTLPAHGHFSPVFSCGPLIQRWSTGEIDHYGTPKHQFTKLAGRIEAGTWIGSHAAITLGCLYGNLNGQRRVAIAYVAFTGQM